MTPFSARAPRSAMLNGMRSSSGAVREDGLDERRVDADVRRHHHDVVRLEIGLRLRKARATDRAALPSRASGCGRNGIGASDRRRRPGAGAGRSDRAAGRCRAGFAPSIVSSAGARKCSCSCAGSRLVIASRNSRPSLPNDARSGLPRSNCRSSCAVAGALRRARASSRSERISLHHSGVGRMTKRCTSIVLREFLEKLDVERRQGRDPEDAKRVPAAAPRRVQRGAEFLGQRRRMQTGRRASELRARGSPATLFGATFPVEDHLADERRGIDRTSCAILLRELEAAQLWPRLLEIATQLGELVLLDERTGADS